MGKFQPGESGNIEGRPQGSTNKTNEYLKQAFAGLLKDNLPQLKKDISEMKAKERANFFLAIWKHLIAPAFNPALLNEEQLKQTIEYYERTFVNQN